jgi:hypothetical protein
MVKVFMIPERHKVALGTHFALIFTWTRNAVLG